ncbi:MULTISPECIES: M4 family metallopeptidase [unclassified Fusibacter]|uniref:M4 family metallopeptidase n=1 Tax=unclassified Fusibacter TaxID=2624464 RepID=UPI0010126844|nr:MULTISPECIES: M4 family metallopeptidase [unclassified Fusibacter]MCK8059159.1 M4 family metallopeptidase [Fusibacter sp. A2]NPE22568.1 peptidase M4 family protein [Fusibacter sp. A1]RXV60670.1 peptidase M4 family protein [Fusibacter sp. A1]
MKKRIYLFILIVCLVVSSFSFAGSSSNGNQAIPVLINGELTDASDDEGAVIVQKYLNEHKSSFKLKENHGFRVKHVEKQNGNTIVRLQQTIDGVPVVGFEQVANIDENGIMTSLAGQLLKEKNVRAGKKINANKAVDIAIGDLTVTPVFEDKPSAKLVYIVDDNGATLAYEIELSYMEPEAGRWFYYVSADKGTVVNKYNKLDTAKPVKPAKPTSGIAVDSSGIDVNGVLRSFKALQSGSLFLLHDKTRGNGIYTYDAANRTRTPGSLWSDYDNYLGAAYDAPAVSAHANASDVYDFYLNVFNRRSYDNNNAKLISSVHYSRNYNNAFWNGSQMVYGDGDGNVFYPLSGALDVVAHELTHAVTEYTCDLIYQNESGAINEALSDIMGTAVEFYYNDDPDYLIGEDISGPGLGAVALRSMADPTIMGDPDHYSVRYTGKQDNGGVHINSSIINKAAYLMAEGGTHYNVRVTGISIEKTADIFYRCMTNYLTASSNFNALKAAAIQSATDLYGGSSAEVTTVIDAFNAVGIQ